MKNFCLFLLFVALISCKETRKTDINSFKVNGSPSSIQYTVYDGGYKFGEIQKIEINSFKQSIFEQPANEYFDSNEPDFKFFNSIYHYVFNFNVDGNFKSIYLLAYNKQSDSYFPSKEGMDTLYVSQYEYPLNNEIIITLTARTPKFAFNYGSFKNGDTVNIRHDFLLDNGEVDSSVFKSYIRNSYVYNFTKCKYEDNKSIVTEFNSDKSISEVIKTSKDGNKETMSVYNGYGTLIQERIKTEYSKNLKVTVENRFTGEQLNYSKTDSSFYDNGNIIKKVVLLEEKRTSTPYKSRIENTYEYKFDNQNNWIEKIRKFKEVKMVRYNEFSNEGIQIVERKIQYYN